MKTIMVSGLIAVFSLNCILSYAEEISADGLMQGFPPKDALQVNRTNFMLPPYNQWAFQNIRELQPTREVYRGDHRVTELEEMPIELGDRNYSVSNNREIDLDTWLEDSGTDAFLVLHRGHVVFERYYNGQDIHTQHQMFSVTKSFIGTLVLMLIEEQAIDPTRTILSYLPELKNSAFADATVEQVLDMTTSISFNEDYTDADADIWAYGYVFGLSDISDASRKKTSIYDYLPTLKKMDKRSHGDAFSYVTPNTDVLAWLLSRVTNESISKLIEKRIWRPMGMQRDAYFWLGRAGTEMAGGGLNMTARDAGRFGQMILQGGKYNGKQIVPPNVASHILQPVNSKNSSDFAYRDHWWMLNTKHQAVSAIGIHGQFIYIDPVAEMVVVKQSSHPEAEGLLNEIDGPLIWQAMAERLIASEQ